MIFVQDVCSQPVFFKINHRVYYYFCLSLSCYIPFYIYHFNLFIFVCSFIFFSFVYFFYFLFSGSGEVWSTGSVNSEQNSDISTGTQHTSSTAPLRPHSATSTAPLHNTSAISTNSNSTRNSILSFSTRGTTASPPPMATSNRRQGSTVSTREENASPLHLTRGFVPDIIQHQAEKKNVSFNDELSVSQVVFYFYFIF